MKQQSLRLALLIALSLGLGACGGELEPGEGGTPPTTTPITTPPTTDPTTPPTTDPVEHQGTWENKDEDGDGVPDEQDDYPFDASKSSYELVHEEEFNNNLAVANIINGGVPFRVIGVVQEHQDLDLYKFQVNERKDITVVLKSDSKEFSPYVTIFDSKGESLQIYKSSYNPVGRVRNAVSFTLAKSGAYYLVVGDSEASGNPDFNYEIHVFDDIDVDLIDDNIESAFGLSSKIQDSDEDRIIDGDEFYVYEYGDVFSHDRDNDGIPNWLDLDSDGDGIIDRIENNKDYERDGFAAFVDLDSDGNGVSDALEVGDNILNPLDQDIDGDYDYIDVDDDADGLLDINDSNPKERVVSVLPNQTGYKDILSISYLYNGQSIDNINIALEPHMLNGTNLNQSGYLVFNMSNGVSPVNIKISGSEGGVFLMPKKASSLYFYSDGVRSNVVDVKYSNPNIPIINSISGEYYREGQTVDLSGVNFNEDTLVYIDDDEISPAINTPTSLSFTLPENLLPSVMVSVKTSYGESNQREIKIGNKVSLELSLPDDVVIEYGSLIIESLRSPTGVSYKFNSALTSQVAIGGGHDIIIISYEDDNNSWPYLYQAAFGGKLKYEISALNSAKSLSWYMAGAKNLVPTSSWESFYDNLSEIAEVQLLADFIEENLTNPKFSENKSAEYNELESAAVKAVKSSIEITFPSSKNSKPTLSMTSKARVPEGAYKPLIEADWVDTEGDIEIIPSEVWDGFADDVFDGNFGVENDTALFLSSRFKLMGEEYENDVLIPHVTSSIDGNVIGPQHWGILNISQTKYFPQCNYNNCDIEVVTPGIRGPYPSTGAGEQARNALIFKTAVEQVILPAIGYIIDRNNLYEDRVWVKKVLTEAYPIFMNAVDLSQSKDTAEVLGKFFWLLRDDIMSNGPASQLSVIIAQKVGSSSLMRVVRNKLAEYLVPLALPVVGEAIILIQAINDALKGVNLANKLLNVTGDLMRVPSVVSFTAQWPVRIDSVYPAAIDKSTITSDVNLIIEGRGFLSLWVYGIKVYPEVSVIDTKETVDLTDDETLLDFETDGQNLVSDGSAIDFVYIEKDKLLNAVGPLKVFVEVSDSKPTPKEIQFVDGIQIAHIEPDEVFRGESVLISGAGFSHSIPENLVTFQGDSGRLQAKVVSAKINSLRVIVPDGAVSGDVTLSVNGRSSKNSYPVIVQESGITARFGDNGNEQDDIFTLFVAGKSVQMSQAGQREIELFQSLAPGEYEVLMTANDIPDERGTYYVCFSDNVEILNGSPVTAKTLLTNQGDQARWNIRVSANSGKIISNCAQSEIKPNQQVFGNIKQAVID
jgi:hypothetical protein